MGDDSKEIIGVNSRDELTFAEKLMRQRSGEKS
jgi:bifunctional N-acetylglucosamine-1-phosphate-uridyltransferase/glucosamine-1-phosphate-acetyltransferase GlmU-like protein